MSFVNNINEKRSIKENKLKKNNEDKNKQKQ